MSVSPPSPSLRQADGAGGVRSFSPIRFSATDVEITQIIIKSLNPKTDLFIIIPNISSYFFLFDILRTFLSFLNYLLGLGEDRDFG